MRIKLIIAYDGTNYYGFQHQNNVLNIEDALSDSSLKFYAYIDKYSNTVRVIKALNK